MFLVSLINKIQTGLKKKNPAVCAVLLIHIVHENNDERTHKFIFSLTEKIICCSVIYNPA